MGKAPPCRRLCSHDADSFTARGLPDGVCTAARNLAIAANVYVRSGDAYAALAALRALPYIDGKRIGIMGGSHGGSTTLAAMVAASDSYAPPDGFIAAIALYPSCSARYGTWSTVQQYGSYGPVTGYAGVYHPLAPLLILTGELDDWTPAEPCRELVERGRAADTRSTSACMRARITRSTAIVRCDISLQGTITVQRTATVQQPAAMRKRGPMRGSA